MKISITTLGCKLNQAESADLSEKLIESGHQIINFSDNATINIVIIRACAVTMGASQTTREYIRRAKKTGAYVIVCGCLENTALPEIDFWAKNDTMVIKKIFQISKKDSTKKQKNRPSRTRAFVKIQSGCNFNCAYCIIPKFRGKSESTPIEKIIKKILSLESNGCNEIVLTGVNICQYKDGENDLSGLLKKIIQKTNIKRIRLGSIDPRLVTDNLIGVYLSDDRFMSHWHLSLQSGSDNILAKMNRGYSTKTYLNIIKKIRKINKNFSFTTDIIVGFPGETEKDFKETLNFAKKICFTKIHVFQYSPRKSTTAEKMLDQIQEKIKKERSKILILSSKKISEEFENKFIGKLKKVLFENKKAGYWHGYTPEYIPIKYKSNKNLANKIIAIQISKTNIIKK